MIDNLKNVNDNKGDRQKSSVEKTIEVKKEKILIEQAKGKMETSCGFSWELENYNLFKDCPKDDDYVILCGKEGEEMLIGTIGSNSEHIKEGAFRVGDDSFDRLSDSNQKVYTKLFRDNDLGFKSQFILGKDIVVGVSISQDVNKGLRDEIKRLKNLKNTESDEMLLGMYDDDLSAIQLELETLKSNNNKGVVEYSPTYLSGVNVLTGGIIYNFEEKDLELDYKFKIGDEVVISSGVNQKLKARIEELEKEGLDSIQNDVSYCYGKNRLDELSNNNNIGIVSWDEYSEGLGVKVGSEFFSFDDFGDSIGLKEVSIVTLNSTNEISKEIKKLKNGENIDINYAGKIVNIFYSEDGNCEGTFSIHEKKDGINSSLCCFQSDNNDVANMLNFINDHFGKLDGVEKIVNHLFRQKEAEYADKNGIMSKYISDKIMTQIKQLYKCDIVELPEEIQDNISKIIYSFKGDFGPKKIQNLERQSIVDLKRKGVFEYNIKDILDFSESIKYKDDEFSFKVGDLGISYIINPEEKNIIITKFSNSTLVDNEIIEEEYRYSEKNLLNFSGYTKNDLLTEIDGDIRKLIKIEELTSELSQKFKVETDDERDEIRDIISNYF